MKKILFTVVCMVMAGLGFAQAQSPVKWTYEARKKSAGVYEVTVTADVEGPWHIYSQNTGKGGPIATSIKFKNNPLVIVPKTNAKEIGKLEKVFDKNFNTNVLYFSDKVQFVQTVKVKGGIKTNLSGTVEYMVCNDSKCLPPVKKSFELKLE